ncbi:uncharacterized protein [Drosophila bipectinata]|uniref:uncharacterized protein n=1 Tax=Drosophila bipectinata TaxID=42026 RepID=UPI0007E89ECB|nr:uncharacterized protein LOC108126570 [Drosophila bipectinata]
MPYISESKRMNTHKSNPKNPTEHKRALVLAGMNVLQENYRQEDHTEAEIREMRRALHPIRSTRAIHQLRFSDESIERYEQPITVVPAPERGRVTTQFVRGYLTPSLEFLAHLSVPPVDEESDHESPILVDNEIATTLHDAQEFHDHYISFQQQLDRRQKALRRRRTINRILSWIICIYVGLYVILGVFWVIPEPSPPTFGQRIKKGLKRVVGKAPK